MGFTPTVLEVNDTNGGSDTDFWEVADIVWEGNTCEVQPLGTPNCPRICTKGEAARDGCPVGTTRGQACR